MQKNVRKTKHDKILMLRTFFLQGRGRSGVPGLPRPYEGTKDSSS